MIRTKKTLLILAAATALGSLALAVDSSPTPAGSPIEPLPLGHNRVDRIGKFAARRLDLSEAQVTALKEVIRLHQPELQPLTQRMREERQALRDIVAATPLDETALEAQAAKIGETQRQLTIANARMRADLRTILTADQLQKLTNFRKRLESHRPQRRARLDAWLSEEGAEEG